MPTLTLGDATFFYEVDGTGDPLLPIAGFGSDSASWMPLYHIWAIGFSSCGPTIAGQGGRWRGTRRMG